MSSATSQAEIKYNPETGMHEVLINGDIKGQHQWEFEARSQIARIRYDELSMQHPAIPAEITVAAGADDELTEALYQLQKARDWAAQPGVVNNPDLAAQAEADIIKWEQEIALILPSPAETVAAIQQTARELLAMPEGIPEPPAYFDGMQRVQWAIDHGYTGQPEAAPATEALETAQATPAPAAPYQTTYKAGRDVLAEAAAALAIGAGDTARIAALAGELCRAYASVKESRDLADKCTRKESRQQFYNDANQRSTRAAALESELIEALAATASSEAERLTFADQHSAGLAAAYARGFADRVDGPDNDTPPASHDQNYYGHSDEPAWAPEDEDPIVYDYDDPEDAERQRIELDRQTEYEAELYAQEYAAGVDEAHGYKGVLMPTLGTAVVRLPAVEIATTAADLRNAMTRLEKAAYRRDRAYAVKAQTESERADLESRLIAQVCEEVNPAGKALYSNDTARKAEVKARLSTYPIARDAAEAEATHLAAKTEYDMAEQEVKTYRALLAHETQILAMQTEIMAGQRQAQDADDLPF